jgi:hypothetical protein
VRACSGMFSDLSSRSRPAANRPTAVAGRTGLLNHLPRRQGRPQERHVHRPTPLVDRAVALSTRGSQAQLGLALPHRGRAAVPPSGRRGSPVHPAAQCSLGRTAIGSQPFDERAPLARRMRTSAYYSTTVCRNKTHGLDSVPVASSRAAKREGRVSLDRYLRAATGQGRRARDRRLQLQRLAVMATMMRDLPGT